MICMENKRDLNQMIVDMGIMLEEELIPHMLQRDYWKEFSKFGTWDAWECFEDQVRRMNNMVELYELLNECDVDELAKLICGEQKQR